MGKSDTTIQLENDIAAIEAKEKALGAAYRALDGCLTKVKSTYNRDGVDHVKGTKYDEMYQDEQDTIKGFSKDLKAKKQGVLDEITANLSTLSVHKMMKQTLLTASRLADAAADAAREKAKKKGGN